MAADDTRDGITFTSLDEPLFDGAGATKRDLVDYLDGVSNRMVPVLHDRALSVIRARPGQAPFMQKNVPKHAPPWLQRTTMWADASQRNVDYALCNDRQSLLWFANQRAVEYHPSLVEAAHPDHMTHLVIDLDPPPDMPFTLVVTVAHMVRRALTDAGLSGAVKTSGAKGLHIFVPIDDALSVEEAAAALRALAVRVEQLDPAVATTAFMKADRGNKVFVDSTRAGSATIVAAYSPRARPGVPVSMPLPWDALDAVSPGDFTIHNALAHLGDTDPWVSLMPPPQRVPGVLVEEGRAIPTPRVLAMHEGKRRARASKPASD
jgi:bifunctional non-homologous end joining protein LigD